MGHWEEFCSNGEAPGTAFWLGGWNSTINLGGMSNVGFWLPSTTSFSLREIWLTSYSPSCPFFSCEVVGLYLSRTRSSVYHSMSEKFFWDAFQALAPLANVWDTSFRSRTGTCLSGYPIVVYRSTMWLLWCLLFFFLRKVHHVTGMAVSSFFFLPFFLLFLYFFFPSPNLRGQQSHYLVFFFYCFF